MNGWRCLDGRPTRIVAHRGASGLFPEHCRPAYLRAVADGADVIEPDLVPSRDGVLFARHDPWLSRSTDIAAHPEFADRRERGLDDRVDWWSDRLDAAELRRLHAIQPFPQRDRSEDGRHGLLDFAEVLDIAFDAGLPVYPELKHPAWFGQRGHDVAAILIDTLRDRGLLGFEAPVWVQSFDAEALGRVREALGLRVFPLLRFAQDGAGDALDGLVAASRGFAAGFAVDKRYLLLPDAAARIDRLHADGFEIHAWTFRDDELPAPFSTPDEELSVAFALGVDAVFCDFPATGVKAREAFELGQRP